MSFQKLWNRSNWLLWCFVFSFEEISWFFAVSKGDGRHTAGMLCLRWGETQEALAALHWSCCAMAARYCGCDDHGPAAQWDKCCKSQYKIDSDVWLIWTWSCLQLTVYLLQKLNSAFFPPFVDLFLCNLCFPASWDLGWKNPLCDSWHWSLWMPHSTHLCMQQFLCLQ